MASDARVGTQVAGYRIEAQLGRGGMSVVYLAEDERLGRKVALKLLAPQLAEDLRFRERFLRESRIAASIDHPNIVPVYEAGEADDALYIAMRYVGGTDLGALIRKEGALEPARTVDLLEQVAAALDAAHAKDLIHRDVKPGNILVSGARETGGRELAYLADFGLTKQRLAGSGFTATGQLVGTIDYVAPEQIKGEPLDARADLYSLGCVLFECLAGRAPFVRDRELAVLWAHVQEEPPSLVAERPDLPSGLDEVIGRAMAKVPTDRHATASELVSDLRAELHAPPGARRRRRRAPKRTRRRRAVAAVAGLVLVVLAVAVLFVTRSEPIVPGVGSLSRIDADTHAFSHTLQLRERPIALAAGSGSLWVATQERTLMRIDPDQLDAGAPPKSLALDGRAAGIAAGEDAVWVLLGFGTSVDGQSAPAAVYRVNPNDDQVERWGDEVPSGSSAVAVGERGVWVTTGFDGQVLRIEPGLKNQEPDRFALPGGSESTSIAIGDREVPGIWTVGHGSTQSVYRIDPEGTQVSTFPLEAQPAELEDIAVGAGSVWVSNDVTDTVYRLDADGDLLAEIPMPDGPAALAVGADGVWVCSYLAGVVSRIDPATNEIVTQLEVEGSPADITVDADGGLWVIVSPL